MRWLSLLLPCALQLACENASPPPVATPAASSARRELPARPWKAAAIAHGGVGSPPERSDGCRKAVDAALASLDKGADPLDAAVEGVVVLEDDPRFNAGTGSRVRIDGRTVQMDASVMDSKGRFGAVAVIEAVKNPVRVARAVVDTPHLILAGDGATAFARTLGFMPYDPATDEMRAEARKTQKKLREGDASLPEAWKKFDWRARWNFDERIDEGHDTVGVAVRAPDGRFAVALSTGGTTITLRGRVGDVPILGAGLYAGTHGASAATGTGERIIEQSLALRVHDWLVEGASPKEAADRAVARIANQGTQQKGGIGIIVIGPDALAAAADRPMAWAAREAGSAHHQGP